MAHDSGLREEARELLRRRIEAGGSLKQELADLFLRTAAEVLSPAGDGLVTSARELRDFTEQFRTRIEEITREAHDALTGLARGLQDSVEKAGRDVSHEAERLRHDVEARTGELLSAQASHAATWIGRVEDSERAVLSRLDQATGESFARWRDTEAQQQAREEQLRAEWEARTQDLLAASRSVPDRMDQLTRTLESRVSAVEHVMGSTVTETQRSHGEAEQRLGSINETLNVLESRLGALESKLGDAGRSLAVEIAGVRQDQADRHAAIRQTMEEARATLAGQNRQLSESVGRQGSSVSHALADLAERTGRIESETAAHGPRSEEQFRSLEALIAGGRQQVQESVAAWEHQHNTAREEALARLGRGIEESRAQHQTAMSRLGVLRWLVIGSMALSAASLSMLFRLFG